MDEIVILKPCAMCAEPTLYQGPSMLSQGDVCCGEACSALWDALTPGHWVSAVELMRGGRYYDRPDIWTA